VAAAYREISVVILTRDEAARLARCVEAVRGIADEILVVDSGSTDATVELAGKLGCRVISNAWPGYGAQRNFGAREAEHDWILFVDADEVVGHDLAEAIGHWKEEAGGPSAAAALSVRRVGDFMGQWLEGSAERLVRLYDRRRCSVAQVEVHETVVTGTKPVGRLPGALWHHGFRSLSDHVARFDRYTTLEAETAFAAGERFSPLRLALKPAARVLQQMMVKRLYRHGVAGLAVCALWVQYDVMRQLKLRELAWRADTR